MKSSASLYKSLEHLNSQAYKPGTRLPVIQDPNGVRDVPRIHIKIKLLAGSYILQVNRAAFNPNQISPICLLCRKEDETKEHFLLRCESLESTRRPILDEILKIHESLEHYNTTDTVQAILDPTVIVPKEDPSVLKNLENQARRLCHALHVKRFTQLPQTVTFAKGIREKRSRNANQQELCK